MIFIIVLFVALAAIDIPQLIHNKQWKEIAVYASFLLIALVGTMLDQVFEYDFSRITNVFIKMVSRNLD
ncbi:MAG: hypothetical protein H7Y41_03855 [Hyphomonadaceae bacterium]|nr:hypothetical protein [Clostridia bacterium]